MIRFIDLFAGIGGFRYGLEKVGRDKLHCEERGRGKQDGETRLGFNCVWSNEWDKYVAQIYRKHFGECDGRDIRTVEPSDIPTHDLICAGFPCQSFSIAGKRKGFDDTRGTLFYEIYRIARFHRTPYLLLENVKGLLNHDNGQTFSVILESLDELGYDCQWQVLNSKNFGVPQNRERVFIVGHLRGESRPKVFPIREGGEADFSGVGIIDGFNRRRSKEIGAVRQNMLNGGSLIEMTKSQSQGYRVYNPEGLSTTLAGEAGGVGAKTGLYAMRGREKGQQLEFRGDETNALTSVQKDNLWVENMKIRRLTPTECERLQGFPDGWTEGISDTQRYKCLGNAVTVNVVRAIGERLRQEVLGV